MWEGSARQGEAEFDKGFREDLEGRVRGGPARGGLERGLVRISKAVQGRICQGEFRGEFEKRGSGGFGKESLGEDLPGRV